MNPQEYFKRIGFKGEVEISIECLKLLHNHHVMSVPFEALDVQFGVPIELTIDKIFEKVVKNNRGGYCYELNYLFQTFLEDLGFDSHLISASIFDNGAYVQCSITWRLL